MTVCRHNQFAAGALPSPLGNHLHIDSALDCASDEHPAPLNSRRRLLHGRGNHFQLLSIGIWHIQRFIGPTVTLRGKASFAYAGIVCITAGLAGLLTSMIATLAVQGGTPGADFGTRCLYY